MLTSVELCAGAGGQALGLEGAGFNHQILVEIDQHCCNTLSANRREWNIANQDIREFVSQAGKFKGVDLLAGGLPCPPFSVAGKQLGERDERNLFPSALQIIEATKPTAIMLENVRGFLSTVFEDYRNGLKQQLKKLGYVAEWRLLNASDYGVSQLRPRVIIVAIKNEFAENFSWPTPNLINPPPVGEVLFDLMSANGWLGAKKWKDKANEIAPTIVGGSMKHGGPDLGPTRAKRAWASLGVNGKLIAESAPERDFVGMPKLTVRMVARLQGFPDDWIFSGKKTPQYRQVGNAFPAPVAQAVANEIKKTITAKRRVFRISR